MSIAIADDSGIRTLADDGDSAVIGLLASADLLLHRLPLQSATAAERLEEARMRAIDLCAQPLDDLHVAVGPVLADGSSWVAIIARARLRARLAEFAAAGVDPVPLLPAALCLGDAPAFAREGAQYLFCTDTLAGVAEPKLLAAVPELAPPDVIADFVPLLRADIAPDLRQGEFAPKIRWWRARRWQISAGVLLILALLLALVPPFVQQRRLAAAAGRFDAQLTTLARAAGVPPAADAAATASRLQQARARCEGQALGAKLTFLAQAVAAAPGAYVESLDLGADGRLRVKLGGSAAAINAARAQLAGGAFAASGHGADVVIGARAAPRLPAADALSAARLRLALAGGDAEILRQCRAAQPVDLAAELAAAGLDLQASDAQLRIAAVRATVLLPLLARLRGAQLTSLHINRNADDTLAAMLETSS